MKTKYSYYVKNVQRDLSKEEIQLIGHHAELQRTSQPSQLTPEIAYEKGVAVLSKETSVQTWYNKNLQMKSYGVNLDNAASQLAKIAEDINEESGKFILKVNDQTVIYDFFIANLRRTAMTNNIPSTISINGFELQQHTIMAIGRIGGAARDEVTAYKKGLDLVLNHLEKFKENPEEFAKECKFLNDNAFKIKEQANRELNDKPTEVISEVNGAFDKACVEVREEVREDIRKNTPTAPTTPTTKLLKMAASMGNLLSMGNLVVKKGPSSNLASSSSAPELQKHGNDQVGI
ncbi:MAG: hypothetical protein ACHP6I_03285 [Rickettsiales bacterium]